MCRALVTLFQRMRESFTYSLKPILEVMCVDFQDQFPSLMVELSDTKVFGKIVVSSISLIWTSARIPKTNMARYTIPLVPETSDSTVLICSHGFVVARS